MEQFLLLELMASPNGQPVLEHRVQPIKPSMAKKNFSSTSAMAEMG